MQVLVFFFVSSIIGLILAAKYVNLLKVFNGIPIERIYISVVVLLAVALWQTGVTQYAGFNHLLIAVMMLPLGVLLQKHDTTPLLFGFLLSEPLIDNLQRVFVIYF